MNFLWEGLNPIYLIPAIVLVCYLSFLGKAVNGTFKVSIPSILSGFLFSLITSSPFILPAHWGAIDYSLTLFLIPLITSIAFTLYFHSKRMHLIKINKKLLIVGIVVYTSSLIYHGRSMGVAHDYWLYGKWISAGSKFEYAAGDHITGYTYGLTIMYTWLGSFAGLFSGAMEQVPVLSFHLEWQVLGSLLFIFITVEIMLKLLNNVSTKVVALSALFASISIETTPLLSLSFYGSFSMFWIVFSLLTVKCNYGKNTAFISLGFLLMVSSTLIVAPLILSTFISLKYSKININERILKYGYIINPLIIIFVWLVSFSFYENFSASYFITRFWYNDLLLISAIIIMKLGSVKVKKVIIINSFVALIASLILNFNWNLTGISVMPHNVMHRYLGFILGHARASVGVTIITFPWAMHLLYEHYRTKKDLK